MKFIGVYLSYKDNCDICLQIDDDNFNLEKDYLKVVKNIFLLKEFTLLKSRTGWVNIYNFLKEKNNLNFYPRAFPWKQRFIKESYNIKKSMNDAIFYNGSVMGDPDIDALARLNNKIDVVGFKKKNLPNGVFFQELGHRLITKILD